jgi:hypothetical protein
MLSLELKNRVNLLLQKVRENPEHQLKPIYRHQLYQLFDHKINQYDVNPMLAHLALLTAKKVLPIWQAVMPLYPPETLKDEADNYDTLPEQLINLGYAVLNGRTSLEAARQAAGNYWYVMGNISDYTLRERREDSAIKAGYAGHAALMALNETVFGSMFERITGWQAMTDDNMGYARDCATEAVKAYSGCKGMTLVDFDKRLEFWEWWLTEALPAANKASRMPLKIFYDQEAFSRAEANRSFDESELESLIQSLQSEEEKS